MRYVTAQEGCMEKVLGFLCKYYERIIQVLSVLISSATLYFAIKIPHRIMINQIYSDLIKEYRSAEMGGAVLSIFHFYVKDCSEHIYDIADEYMKKSVKIRRRFRRNPRTSSLLRFAPKISKAP
jgi:hypothetical protein